MTMTIKEIINKSRLAWSLQWRKFMNVLIKTKEGR